MRLQFKKDSWHARLWLRMHVQDKRWLALLRSWGSNSLRRNSSKLIAKRNEERFQQNFVSLCPYFWSTVAGVLLYLPFVLVARPGSDAVDRFLKRFPAAAILAALGLMAIPLTHVYFSDFPERRAESVLQDAYQKSEALIRENAASLWRIARREHAVEIAEQERQAREQEREHRRLRDAAWIHSALLEWPENGAHALHINGEAEDERERRWTAQQAANPAPTTGGLRQSARDAWDAFSPIILFFLGALAALVVAGAVALTVVVLVIAASQTALWKRISAVISDTWSLIREFIKYRYREHLCPYITFHNGESS